MSSDKKIGAPFVLASLPRPGNTTPGHTQAASVCSISGAKKRKRPEVAVGVDGEGIFVYSLQNPHLVTSYALPPQTAFATAPYSLYRKGTSKRSSFRFTYAAVAPSGPGEKLQIVCFSEEVHRDGTSQTVKSAYSSTSPSEVVVAIDSIPLAGDSAKNGSHDMLVVFASGHIICLSSNLETLRWDADLKKLSQHPQYQEELETEYVTVTTAKAAIGGLLRNRQDIAAILDPSFEADADVLGMTPVLCAIFRLTDHRRILGLFHIQPRSPDLITSHLLPVKELLTWDLPTAPSASLSEPKALEPAYQLHPSTGVLHQLSNGHIFSYDFSGTVPKLYSNFCLPGSRIGSFLRVSPDLIFSTAGQSFGMFDVKYGSVQAILPHGQSTTAEIESKKRKHVDHEPLESSEVPNLVAYFSELGLVVGISNHDIVGIQIMESASRKRLKSNETLLVNAIGKGLSAESPVLFHDPLASGQAATSKRTHGNNGQQEQEWERRVHKLDRYFTKGKIAEFEKLFAAHLGIELADSAPLGNGESSTAQTTINDGIATPIASHAPSESALSPDNTDLTKAPGDASHELQKWLLPPAITDSQRSRHRQSAMYALRKIFHFTKTEPSSKETGRRSPLKVEFFPPNVFQWLLLSGYLTKESLRRAIQEDSPNDFDVATSISDGDIVKAIVQFDPELHILSAVLNHGHFLPVGEVVQAIKVLMQSLDDRPVPDAVQGLLTNGTAPEEATDMDLASELDAATQDLDHAMSILDNGIVIRSHNLRPALIRLHTFPPPVIASTLRSMLPRRELESLIQLLHSELRNGGWTSSYDFLQAPRGGPDDQAVAIIASLLNCSLDAIGAGAWLASVGDSASEESSEDMIQDLLHDTSEALNGFWEARFMRGLLSEFLRYASDLTSSQIPSNSKLRKQGKPTTLKLAHEDHTMLPLGGKVDLGIEKTKPGKGGKGEKRSAREIGMLISKRVPKYSIEKIEI